MTTTRLLLIIAVCALSTMFTRAIPFLVFRDANKVPKIILYLGKVLPPAVIATLVIYALRNTEVVTGAHGIPELIGVLCAGALHWFFKNSFVSIGIATILYMVLIRII